MKNCRSNSLILHLRIYNSFHEVPVLSAPFQVKMLRIKPSNSVPVAFIDTNHSKSMWFPSSYWYSWRFSTIQADDNRSVHRTSFKTMLWGGWKEKHITDYRGFQLFIKVISLPLQYLFWKKIAILSKPVVCVLNLTNMGLLRVLHGSIWFSDF